MIRRWLVSCTAMWLGVTLSTVAVGQAPSSLAERIQQLRRDWSHEDDSPEPTPAENSVPVSPPRAGSASAAATNNTHTGLPTVDPRSVMPSQLFGRSTSSPTARHLSSPSEAAPRPVARKSPSKAPTSTPAYAAPNYSTARRSPQPRARVDVKPDVLHDELTGAVPTPAAVESKPPAAAESPTILDDFAAGLAHPTPTRQEPTPTAAKSAATSSGPASLPSSSAPEPTVAEPEVAAAAPKSIDATDRYAAPSGPAAAFAHDRPSATSAASAPAPAESPEIKSEAAKVFQADPISLPGTARSSAPTVPHDTEADSAHDARRESFSKSDTAVSSGSVLVANAAPAIVSDIRGPRQIAVGRASSYRVRLQNQGGGSASAVVATVRIPVWAEVFSTTATDGVVHQLAADDTTSTLQWQITRLDPQAAEVLNIDLVPRASRPLDLGVTWTHDPVNTHTVVEVQEPRLKLEVSGPEEVLYGKSHVYRLTLSNPGTGVAEHVRINLLPPGGGDQTVSTFEVGDLAPGASKSAEVELTAREAGKLSVEAVAVADGDLRSEAAKEIFCRKPELEVDWRGPDTQYAGTPATYFFRVRNPGTAAADDVAVQVALPAGAEFVSASEGNAYDRTRREVVWRVGTLGPGDDRYMKLRCNMNTPGENKLAINATTAAGDLSDSKVGATNVVALADLKLDVSDPPGPVAVGAEAVYEIHVTNRGASAAEEVNVVGLFSAGLEPETGDGAPYTVSDGRVAFRTINKLPAGQSVVLTIRAKATEPGTHVFRAEVLCRDLEIKLAAEETTRFYEDALLRDVATGSQPTIGANYEQPAR